MHRTDIKQSVRLQRIIELFKRADHPLSSMEVTLQAFTPNAATYIKEIRDNDGYSVSKATAWKGLKYPWHDGNPRYWLIAAPGWVPRWTITPEGEILSYTERGTVRSAECGVPACAVHADRRNEGETINPPETTSLDRHCRLQRCGRPIPEDKPGNTAFCCNAHKDEYWKMGRDLGKAMLAAGQGKLGI